VASRRALRVARAVAAKRSERLFLAGGVVRDLLLGRPIRDVDLVVEGDALAFARELALRLGARTRVHARFGTATLGLPSGGNLDVAASRCERYERPGALPDVDPGAPIEADLGRRDFAINALALELGPRPRVLDPFAGREDLKRGVVRALHEGSFRDDPTRALRAVRYANRLGFRLEPATRRSIVAAMEEGALDLISADRLRRELRLLLEEPERARALGILQGLTIDAAIHPRLGRRPGAIARLRRAEAWADRFPGAKTWVCYLLSWMGEATEEEVRGVADRLGVSGPERRRLLEWPDTVALFPAGIARQAPSERRNAARNLSPDELVALSCRLGTADARALRDAAPGSPGAGLSIRGSDLVSAGVAPGPSIGRALDRTRAALEDGRIAPAEQLAFALRAARREDS
jgi:tRNA nucleotidyltransferase (CCA-adding enzyme)